jgi:hypothetical protein
MSKHNQIKRRLRDQEIEKEKMYEEKNAQVHAFGRHMN